MLSTPPAIIRSASPRADRAGGMPDGIEPGAAQPVHSRAARPVGQAGQQPRHARDVAVVLARLVGAAEITSSSSAQSTFGLRSISARIGIAARSSARTDASAPVVTADRRANRVADESFGHELTPDI